MNNSEMQYKVTEKNCNGILTRLYARRDGISHMISMATVSGNAEERERLENQYFAVCEEIEQLCEYRRMHDCLTEGDPGFSFY